MQIYIVGVIWCVCDARMPVLLLHFLLIFQLFYIGNQSKISEKSPYYQYLPGCNESSREKFVYKKNNKVKGLLCPMVKDEVGFLSEWVAFVSVTCI